MLIKPFKNETKPNYSDFKRFRYAVYNEERNGVNLNFA